MILNNDKLIKDALAVHVILIHIENKKYDV